LIERRLWSADGCAELDKLATRLIVDEAFEAEAGDAVGREDYTHGRPPGGGYRNGNRKGRLRTAQGLIENGYPLH
jgi:transposase-like protein